MGKSKIEWTEMTWNPIVGCSKISAGCKNCYAERMAPRIKGKGVPHYQDVVDKNGWTGKIGFSEKILQDPLGWKKPRHIFVCSMGDLFHEKVKPEWQDKIFNMMAICEDHTFLVLTKRPDNMAKYFKHRYTKTYTDKPNLWLGVTAESMKYFHPRVGKLAEISAAVKFVSLEPLLSPIDFDLTALKILDWVIVGCESGPRRRECKLEWVQSIVTQCKDAGVPCFVKQIPILGKVSHDMNHWPPALQVRERCDG